MTPNRAGHDSIKRQLLSNQVWETVAFAAKAFFVIGLTPWMLRVWGVRGYGEFALASSLFVFLAILDLGVRSRTRVALCQTRSNNPSEWPIIMGQGLAACGIVSFGAIAIAALTTVTGCARSLMGVSIHNSNLLLVTTALAMSIMFSGLLLEPLVASSLIGRLKLAVAAGWFAAILAVAVVLLLKWSVTIAIVAWLGCLLLANVITALASDLQAREFFRCACATKTCEVITLLREGFWFSVANATWLTKTYGVTLLIFALDGPATAGVFYILLRLSEIISALGAIAADVSLGDLALAADSVERLQSFRSSYSWALLFCSYGALVIGFFTSDFDRTWLHSAVPVSPFAGVVIAALGLASALNRTATYAAMALGAVRGAAKWGAVEAIVFILILLAAPRSLGLVGQLAAASLSACALLPLARLVSRQLGTSSTKAWIRPIVTIAPGVGVAAMAIELGVLSGSVVLKFFGGTICGGIALAHIIAWQNGSDESGGGYLRARQAKFKQNAVLESA